MRQANNIILRDRGPFEGLQKLLDGFCDPRKAMGEDNEHEASIVEDDSLGAHAQSEQVNSTDDSDRKAPSLADTSVDSKADTEVYQKDQELKDDADGEELQEANSLQESSVRSTRRSQVVLFASAAVMLTIYALSYLGFTMDFTVIESPRMAAEPKNLINIGMAAKIEAADTTVEDAKSRDEIALESLKALKELVAEIKEL